MVTAKRRWALRDWLAAVALFITTAAVVFWQNAHVAVLWDLSYTLDTAARIAQGQFPYRDFPFAHAPLTFLIQAAVIRLTGRVFFHHIIYAVVVGGLGTVITFRIVLHSLAGRVNAAWPVALILAAPLSVLGIYCILPVPSYDCDCAFAVLVAIFLLQQLTPASGWLCGIATGAALSLPLFFKQNIGLPFLAAASSIIALSLAAGLLKPPAINPWTRALLAVLTGVATTILAAILLIHFTVGLGSYVYWTIQFAALRRLPGLQQMLGVYQNPQLLWTLPCIVAALFRLRSAASKRRTAQVVSLSLLAAPFIYTLCTLLIYDDADERGDSLLALWPLLLILAAAVSLWNLRNLRRSFSPFLPILLLIAIHGTLMSQQLWGSTYAIWPLLILLIAEMLAWVAEFQSPALDLQQIAPALATVIAVTLLVCGSFYMASEERLSYAQLPAGPVQHSAFPELRGMSIAGQYLPDLDELLRYADAHIPKSDGLLLIPGEDPFYFATGRTPQFPVLLLDPATDPLSPAQVVEQTRQRNIRWLIVKRNLQLTADPMPQREATLHLLMNQFAPVAHLHAYDIYQSR